MSYTPDLITIIGTDNKTNHLIAQLIQYLTTKRKALTKLEFEYCSNTSNYWSDWKIKSIRERCLEIASSITGISIVNFSHSMESLPDIWDVVSCNNSNCEDEDTLNCLINKKSCEKFKVTRKMSKKHFISKLYNYGNKIHPNFWKASLVSTFKPNEKYIIEDIPYVIDIEYFKNMIKHCIVTTDEEDDRYIDELKEILDTISSSLKFNIDIIRIDYVETDYLLNQLKAILSKTDLLTFKVK